MNWKAIRNDFPALATTVRGKPLVYLDNAATAQKPRQMIDRIDQYWVEENANVHRGVHYRSQIATTAYEGARANVQLFLNASSPKEIVFTKGCTEAVNLVAHCLETKATIRAGSIILVSTLEHHSNIVPWQLVAERTGAKVIPIPVTDLGELDLTAYENLLNDNVAVVAVSHVSNALGVINPVKHIVALAHAHGALTLVDGAQAGPHLAIDVVDIDTDFYTLSCHKMYAPTGMGVLYGKLNLLNSLPPYQGGGDMIRTVSFDGSTFAESPTRFEAGTPNIAGAIGLGATIDYLAALTSLNSDSYRANLVDSFAKIESRENDLYTLAADQLREIAGIKIYGDVPHKAAVLSFTTDWAHPHDIGTVLDSQGVAIRAGHHCCQPLMNRFEIAATVRASFAFYNDESDVTAFVAAVKAAREMFA